MPSVVCMLVRPSSRSCSVRYLPNGGMEGIAWSNDKRMNKRVPIIFGINGNERLQRFDFGNSLESGAP